MDRTMGSIRAQGYPPYETATQAAASQIHPPGAPRDIQMALGELEGGLGELESVLVQLIQRLDPVLSPGDRPVTQPSQAVGVCKLDGAINNSTMRVRTILLAIVDVHERLRL